jgi:hypothetical protein
MKTNYLKLLQIFSPQAEVLTGEVHRVILVYISEKYTRSLSAPFIHFNILRIHLYSTQMDKAAAEKNKDSHEIRSKGVTMSDKRVNECTVLWSEMRAAPRDTKVFAPCGHPDCYLTKH